MIDTGNVTALLFRLRERPGLAGYYVLGRANDPMLASPDVSYRFEKGNRNLMSVLNDLLNTGLMGEPQRLDYVIREHERLQRRVSDLEELLKSKGIISDEERTRLAGLPAAASESGA